MKLTKSQLKQIIREELSAPINEEPQSWNEIIIDKTVTTLLESTWDFNPPQESLDILEAKVRELLSNKQLQEMLFNITRKNQ